MILDSYQYGNGYHKNYIKSLTNETLSTVSLTSLKLPPTETQSLFPLSGYVPKNSLFFLRILCELEFKGSPQNYPFPECHPCPCDICMLVHFCLHFSLLISLLLQRSIQTKNCERHSSAIVLYIDHILC